MSIPSDGLGFLVGDIYRMMRRAFAQAVGDGDLTMAQSRALVYIARFDGLRQVALAELLDTQPITVGRLVDQLEAMALVERRPDPEDRRARQVHVLPAADSHLAVISDAIDDVRKQAFASLDPDDADQLMRNLVRVRADLSAYRLEPKGARGTDE